MTGEVLFGTHNGTHSTHHNEGKKKLCVFFFCPNFYKKNLFKRDHPFFFNGSHAC